jgi:hypothetical protein
MEHGPRGSSVDASAKGGWHVDGVVAEVREGEESGIGTGDLAVEPMLRQAYR